MAKYIHDVGHSLPSFSAALDDSPGILVKAGPTLVFGWTVANGEAAASYVQMFDAAALGDVTLGTTVADYVIPNAASANTSQACPMPLYFALGLCIFSTTDATGSTGASQDVCIQYA